MKNLIYPLLLFFAFNQFAIGQTTGKLRNQKISFGEIHVVKLDAFTQEPLENWDTKNRCVYEFDKTTKILSYIERDPKGVIINNWACPIIKAIEDPETISYTCLSEQETITIILWKDGRMVAIEASDFIHLIAGKR